MTVKICENLRNLWLNKWEMGSRKGRGDTETGGQGEKGKVRRNWIPAFAGMTEKGAGMTEKGAGMTEDSKSVEICGICG